MTSIKNVCLKFSFTLYLDLCKFINMKFLPDPMRMSIAQSMMVALVSEIEPQPLDHELTLANELGMYLVDIYSYTNNIERIGICIL